MTTRITLTAVALRAAGNALHSLADRLHTLPFVGTDTPVWFTSRPWGYHSGNHYLVVAHHGNPVHVYPHNLFRLAGVTVACTADTTHCGSDYPGIFVLMNFMESGNLLEGRDEEGYPDQDTVQYPSEVYDLSIWEAE